MSVSQELRERRPSLRQYYARKRTDNMHIACTPETKARIRKAAADLLMNNGEFIEWLMRYYSQNLVVIMEEGAFLDGLLKTVEKRSTETAASVAELTVHQILYDKGLLSSPRPT